MCFQLYYEDLCKKKGKKNLELKTKAREKYKNLNPKKKIKYIALSAIELYTYEVSAARDQVWQKGYFKFTSIVFPLF